MNREIKFRVWADGKMYLPDSVELMHSNYSCIDIDGTQIGPGDSCSGWSSIDDVELMQYTGLKDKNGKEIYEGDLIRINNLIEEWKRGEPEFDWRIFKIEYNEYTWAFNNSVLYMPMSKYHEGRNGFYNYEIDVVGNIYENPELIEEA